MLNGSPSSVIRLLRTGIVPAPAVDTLSVGYSRFRSELTAALDEFLKGKYQRPIFVNGEWGTGKSHSLAYIRQLASNQGIPTAHVSLNARSVPLNYPQRIYGELAACLRIGDHLGLRPLLHSLLTEPATRKMLKQYAAKAYSNPLSWSIQCLNDFYERGDCMNPQADMFWAFVLGEDLGWADYAYKREQALDRMQGLADLFRAVNGGGIVLLMDEVETIDQLWNCRSRAVAYAVMARIARIQYAWSIFAITERFSRLAALDAPRLDGNATSHDARWLLNAFSNGTIRIFDTPQLDRVRALRLANAVAQLYHDAYPVTRCSEEQLQTWVDEWGRNPSKNPRRLIRYVVNNLDVIRPLEIAITQP